jgi:hypothetical protein
MTTVDELREVLEHRAGVPDTAGMIEAAQTGAARVRRRRRITAATVAAGLAVVIAVGTPVALGRSRTADPLPAAPSPYRGPGDWTVRLEPDPDRFVLERRIEGAGQVLAVRYRDVANRDQAASVKVYDPGTYDSAWLESGERITVDGHPAFYTLTVTSRPTGPATDPSVQRALKRSQQLEGEGVAVIGWQDRSGAWVTVGGTRSRAALQKLAEAVRLGPPQRTTSPVQFGRVPDGMRLGYILTEDATNGPEISSFTAGIGFTTQRSPAPLRPGFALPWDLDSDTALSVLVQPKSGTGWAELVDGRLAAPQWRTIAGHRAWYAPEGTRAFSAGSGDHLLVEAGKCGVVITAAGSGRISYDELARTLAGMAFADCTDPSTWLPVLP